MGKALEERYLTSKKIQENLDKDGVKGREWFSKKFKNVLSDLNIDVNDFKSTASEGGRGHFIFDGEDVPKKIREVFYIYDKSKKNYDIKGSNESREEPYRNSAEQKACG